MRTLLAAACLLLSVPAHLLANRPPLGCASARMQLTTE